MCRSLGKTVTGNSREGAYREDERKDGEVEGGKWGGAFSSPPEKRMLAL